MNLPKKILAILLTLVLLCPTVVLTVLATESAEQTRAQLEASFENAYGGAKGIVSLTFDDSIYPTALAVDAMCEKYGMQATMMMRVDKILDPSDSRFASADKWTALFAKGRLEPQCHTYTHMDLRSTTTAGQANQSEENFVHEIVDSKAALEELFPEYDILAFASANGSLSSEALAYVKQTYYAQRGISGTNVNTLDPPLYTTGGKGSYANLYSPSARESATEEEQLALLYADVDKTVSQCGWYTPFIHRAADGSSTEEMSAYVLEEYFKYIDAYQETGDLWVTTLCSAIKYIRERQNSTLTAYSVGDTVYVSASMAEVTGDGLPLSTDVFDHALTARVTLPKTCAFVSYQLDGVTRVAETTMAGDSCVALIDVIPNAEASCVTMIGDTPGALTASTGAELSEAIGIASLSETPTTITLTASLSLTEPIYLDSEAADITIDLDGTTLTVKGFSVGVGSGALTIKNGSLVMGSRGAVTMPEGATGRLTLDGITASENAACQAPILDLSGGEVVLKNTTIVESTNVSNSLPFAFGGLANAQFGTIVLLKSSATLSMTDSVLEVYTRAGVSKTGAYFRTALAADEDFCGKLTVSGGGLYGNRVGAVLLGSGVAEISSGARVIGHAFTLEGVEERSLGILLGGDGGTLNVTSSTVGGNWQAIAAPFDTETPHTVNLKDALLFAANEGEVGCTDSAILGGVCMRINIEDTTLLGDALATAMAPSITGAAYRLMSSVKATGDPILLTVTDGEVRSSVSLLSSEVLTLTLPEGYAEARTLGKADTAPLLLGAGNKTVEQVSTNADYQSPIGFDLPFVTTDAGITLTFQKIVSGKTAELYTVYYTADTDPADVPNTFFAERQSMSAREGELALECTPGSWDGCVYTYSEQLRVGETFYSALGANVALGESIDIRYYIPTGYEELILATYLNGTLYETSQTVEGYYTVNYTSAPKDAYRAFTVALALDLNGDGEEDARLFLDYSLAEYLETLAALPADNTGYAEAAGALVPYIARYVVEIAEHFGTSDFSDESYLRLVTLGEGLSLAFNPDPSRVIENDPAQNPGVTAAYLLLESRVGYVFTIDESLVSDGTAFTLSMLDDAGAAVGDAVTGTVHQTDGGVYYVSFGTVEAKHLLCKVKVTVTTSTEEGSETAEIYYDLYTYVYNMVESGQDDGFATAAYFYAQAVKTFDALGYESGRLV